MTRRLSSLAVACTAAALAACTSGKSETPTNQGAPGPAVLVSASAPTVVANGTNTVTLNVTNTGSSPATLVTDRGTFQGAPAPGTSVTVNGASAQVTLVTCNSTTPGCDGVATVTGSSTGETSGQATVTFQSPAVACAANCAVDPSCPGLTCTQSGGGSGTCSGTTPSACTASTGGGGGGGTAANGVTVAPTRARLPANGTATTAVVVTVMNGTSPVSGAGVSLATTLGTVDPPMVGTTGSDGTATFTYTASAVPGTATLTASTTAAPVQTGTATITMPALGRLQLASTGQSKNGAQFAVQGAITSGWQEFGFLQVQVLDALGQRYPDGLSVVFEHQPLGGSTLADPAGVVSTAGCAVSGFSPCVTDATPTTSGSNPPDSQGLATTYVYSGTLAGTLQVTARATVNGVTSSISMPTVAVVGAKASGANFALVCSPRNVPALADTDCSVSFVDAPFSCEAILKDRFSNVLGRSTQVIFGAEAGAVGQPTWTTAYDPTTPGNGQMNLGVAVQTINTLGAGLPFDVDPITTLGEPSVVHALDGCGPRTHNPRDGVVTVIAIADGEEAFFDSNGNGRYDVGEPFVDQGEPFIDQNDNGVWDPGEWFLDLDGNGTWTPPNGRWDANTKIWTQTYVVFTGYGAVMVDGSGNLLGTRVADVGSFVDACTATPAPTSFDVAAATTVQATSESYFVVASDYNFNFLPTAASYSVDVLPMSAPLVITYNGLPKYADLTGIGWRYWPCDQNGSCASQCRATGSAAPCQMAPQFTSFSCGLTSSLTITGGSSPASATVRWNVDVPWTSYGSGYDQTTRAVLSGSSH